MRLLRSLWKNTDGAVAPLVALSLVGLIAAGGIAFDYAHLASMHTELQDAADQAALAAATQLDGGTDTRTRATAAAQSLLSNLSLFASDAGTDSSNARKVTIATVNLYQSYNDSNDTFGPVANASGSNARVVEVVVGGRRADYALTPIVAAFTSGSIDARAAASLSSAVCNVPPMMVCQPSGSSNFPADTDIGRGIRLQPGPTTGAWAPGDYGYLDFGNGASGLKINLGKNNDASGCVDNSAGIPTEPGNKASVTDALNSRFDLYPAAASACDNATGDYCPSQNTRKDLVMNEQVDVSGVAGTVPPNPGCGAPGAKITGKSNSTDTNGFVQSTATKGFTRDICHTTNTCTGGNYGDGNWDRSAYFAAEHPSDTVTAVASSLGKTSTTLTRYDMHKWELANTATRLAPRLESSIPAPSFKAQGQSGNGTWTFTNQCSYPAPKNAPPGVAASSTQKDRRVLTVAVVDCTGLNGKSNVTVKNWVDVYLVEPSLNRSAPYATQQAEIYGEVIGVAKRPNGQSAFQFYLRQRPRLIR